jgi:hypothetical protein
MRFPLTSTVILTFSFCSILGAAQRSRNQIEDMKLLSNNIGWAATVENLFWTSDGGHSWKNVMPKTAGQVQIRSTFFLDSSSLALVICEIEYTTGCPTLRDFRRAGGPLKPDLSGVVLCQRHHFVVVVHWDPVSGKISEILGRGHQATGSSSRRHFSATA